MMHAVDKLIRAVVLCVERSDLYVHVGLFGVGGGWGLGGGGGVHHWVCLNVNLKSVM